MYTRIKQYYIAYQLKSARSCIQSLIAFASLTVIRLCFLEEVIYIYIYKSHRKRLQLRISPRCCGRCLREKAAFQEINKHLMVGMEEKLHSNASADALQQFAFDFKCQGGLGIILSGAYCDQMKVDQIQKIDYYVQENGTRLLNQNSNKSPAKQTQKQLNLRISSDTHENK
ncbi:Hypothetical_protein [Hexamita inflata]|uniref:Hypothetical_protein n=1 Tax=Hexamita inflata TaxID=28002 RepID=A0AA86QYU7_9EUKA|nr:Hypothetical protein HINF_LOCUS54785 [Hexamita inflata]